MKKFQFSLGTVLDYKNQVLDSLQAEHAALVQRLRAQEAQLAAAQARYAALNQEFRQAEREGITAARAMGYESGLRYLEGEIQREERLLCQIQEEVERKRQQVVAARQETASLEKLRAHKRQDYDKQVQKSEEQFIDELVSAARAANADAS